MSRRDQNRPGRRGLLRPAPRPWRSLSFQLSFPVGVVIFLAVTLAAYLNIHNQRRQFTARVTAESLGFAEALRRDTFRSMLADQRGHLYHMIQDLTDQPGLERVRIFNSEGRVVFSTQPDQKGVLLDKRSEPCLGCHAGGEPRARLPGARRSRIFTASPGRRLLSAIAPVYNQPSCSGPPCHVHSPAKKVLGVLEVTMSLADMDRRLDQELRRTLLFALALFLGVSTIIGLSLIFTVNRAVKGMSAEVDRLASGDHDVALIKAPAELGRLAESISHMAQRVARRTEALNRRYRHLVLNSTDAILALDHDGRLLLANPEAGRILGRSPEELKGAPLAELAAKEDRPVLARALEQIRNGRGDSDLISLRVVGAGGRIHTLEGRLRRAAREEGLGPVVGNFMDITDRSNLEEQAARNARLAAVGLTVAGLAPYIKNLIHGLNNASYIVGQGLESKDLDMVRQAWGMVTRSVDRVSSVADDLLYYADYQLGERQTFDLNHLLQDVRRLALERAGRGAAAILVRQNSACRQAVMDQKGLRRALLNLAVNALDAAAQREGAAGEGRVVLGCGRTEFGQVEITVEDNGPGIPEEVGRYLFTGLFTTKGAKGTGMGLLLCQKIVEEHGGFVTYSCPLTGGTRFTILIPDQVSDEKNARSRQRSRRDSR